MAAGEMGRSGGAQQFQRFLKRAHGDDVDAALPRLVAVVPGDEYAAQSGARGGADLGAHAAYAQHRAGDGDLAGHGRVGGDGFARDGRTHGHGHGKACRGAVHQRTAGKVDVYIVALDGDAHAGKRRARRLGGVARRAGSAEAVAAAIGDLLLRHHAGDAQLAMPRAGHGLGAQDSAHLRAGDGEGVHLPRHIAPRGARLAQARAARTGSDVFHVRAGDAAAPFLPRRGRRQLHEVDRRAGAVGVAGGQQGILPGQGSSRRVGRRFSATCASSSRSSGRKNISMQRERRAGGMSAGLRVVAPMRRKSAGRPC